MLAVGKFMIIVSCIILFDTAEKASSQPRGGLAGLQFKHIFLFGRLCLKRGLKYVGRCGYRTIYVNLDVYEKVLDAAWKTGKSLNELINEFLYNLVGQTGEMPKAEADYNRLKREFLGLVRETQALVKTLRDLGTYEQLTGLAFSLGLKADLSNMREIIPKIMDAWKEDQDSLSIFIDLLETAHRKREIQKALNEIRKSQYTPFIESAQHA